MISVLLYCDWATGRHSGNGRADWVPFLCTWPAHYTASQRVSKFLNVLLSHWCWLLFLFSYKMLFNSIHTYSEAATCSALKGIKWYRKMILILWASLVLEWALRKKKSLGRCYLPQLDVLALWASISVLYHTECGQLIWLFWHIITWEVMGKIAYSDTFLMLSKPNTF